MPDSSTLDIRKVLDELAALRKKLAEAQSRLHATVEHAQELLANSASSAGGKDGQKADKQA